MVRRTRSSPRARGWARDPLVHFALLAAILWGAHLLFADGEDEEARRTITLDAAFVDGLEARAVGRTGRTVDRASVERAWIREEVLVREARALGFDRGDPVVRRRLVQKMEIWLASSEADEDGEVDDATLREAIARDPDRYDSGRPGLVRARVLRFVSGGPGGGRDRVARAA